MHEKSLVMAVVMTTFLITPASALPKDMDMGQEKGSVMQEKDIAVKALTSEEKALISEEERTAVLGRAEIYGTAEESTLYGEVDLTDTSAGLKVTASISDVPRPGKHGFHIHTYGNCDDGGKAAGGHYNPHNVKHGYLPKDGNDNAHLGDLGSIDIDDEGKGELSVLLPGVSLTSGKNNVAGRAFILHAKEDDFGQPTGNAGGRIGCGTILVVSE